ncbi:phosphotransferase [Ectothiorhodospiraceae bacterium WFHF3C12]|nr:phosphotransferase [Ectothiorhodospiraceae bacterium WFHF3C12]
MDQRLDGLKQWLAEDLDMPPSAVDTVAGDASFRRYFRVFHGDESYIAMDAPPDHEDIKPFMTIAWALRDCGVNVPEVLEVNQEQGFLLLSDLGDRLYLDALDANSVEHLYGDALETLERIQTRGPRDQSVLPPYDSALLGTEMSLFTDWLLGRHLGLSMDAGGQAGLDAALACLTENALDQPRVCVHRDYHSRNLMVVEDHNPGVLDFQDAVVGPVTYDLVSLLRDCYIAWPRSRVEAWALEYRARPAVREIAGDVDDEQWLRWFDLMGIQRHLKASGIFARLYHRDGKPGYLGDIPRTLRYVAEAGSAYPEMEPLVSLVEEDVLPALERG